ncbi:MAG: S-layer homology domain-containing protein, partial [Bacteroidota bacterium]
YVTANHCLSSFDAVNKPTASTMSFIWRYESPTCNRSGNPANDGPTNMTTVGATVIANSSRPGSVYGTDFAILELAESPVDANYDVYYLGWDASSTAHAAAVGIHHPSGDVKKISFSDTAYPLTSTRYTSSTVQANSTHWRVNRWASGTTEGGSSGSPLFNSSTKKAIGHLSGGYASCFSATSSDWYGQTRRSWTGFFTSDSKRRMRDWLDPNNTNTTTINGYYPGNCNSAPEPVLPSDVRNHWAKAEIGHMLNEGYMSGYPDGTFRPDRTLTRAEFAAMMVAVLQPTSFPHSSRNFNDIGGHWARNVILKAARAGYLAGFRNSDGSYSFKPNDKVTRLQVNIAVYATVVLSGGDNNILNYFNDQAQIPGWARTATGHSLASIFIAADPRFGKRYYKPNDPSTRANAVVVLYQTLSKTGQIPVSQVHVNRWLIDPNAPTPDTDDFAKNITASTSNTEIFPNPAREVLYVASEMGIEKGETPRFEIYDVALGRLMKRGSLRNPEIELDGLETGVYILRLSTSDSFVTKRFIKQ